MPKTSKKIEISKEYFDVVRNDNRRLHFSYNKILSELKGQCLRFEFAKRENDRLLEENSRLTNENIVISKTLDATIVSILFGIKNKK